LLLQKYYVVYVRVPSGYPGVQEEWVNSGTERPDNFLRQVYLRVGERAVIKVLEAK